MKKLKEPKSFKRPRAYIRIAGKRNLIYGSDFRLHIIYPDGKAEWSDSNHTLYKTDSFSSYYPCWHDNDKICIGKLSYTSIMSAEDAVKAMKAYDKEEGYKTLFIGEF